MPEVEELNSRQEIRVVKDSFAPLYSEVFAGILVFRQESTHYLCVLHLVGLI